ncbi:hypothetical protein C0J52_08805 [Blattella germanica]|nr:hypothetical protein C0J52_08805 [Blattella germanica]
MSNNSAYQMFKVHNSLAVLISIIGENLNVISSGRTVHWNGVIAEDKNPDVLNLDDGQLKALLDEAITYKRPKDREGKSDLFRELLQEAEADESECGDGRRGAAGSVAEQVVPVSGSRYYSNSNRRRGRRDTAVSERQTRGGSLQNLVHAFNSEFDTSGFGYFGQSSGHSGGVGRRKSKRGNGGRDYGVSVSARQREGGSLPSNVNVGGAGGGMLTLSGLEFPPTAPLSSAATAALLFDDARGYSNKQNKQRKELGHTLSANEFTSAMPVHSSTNVSYQAGGETPNNVSKAEFMVVDLGDVGENGQDTKTNSVVVGDSVVDSGGGKGNANNNDACSNGVDEELGTEMEVIQRSEATRVANYTSLATLQVGLGDCSAKNKNAAEHGDVDTTVEFPLGIIQHVSVLSIPPTRWIATSLGSGDEDVKQEEKKQRSGRRQLDGGSSLIESRDDHMFGSVPLTHWRNFYGFTFLDLNVMRHTVNRLTFHGSKESSGDGKNKSLDENGNAVNQNFRLESINSNDRKGKTRRMKTNNDRNVIMSQNIEGHRGDKDIESLIKFIESNTETKGKTKNNSTHSNGPVGFNSKQQRNNMKREEVVGGTKTRREKTVEDGHDEEKSSGKSRVGGKQNSKEHRTGDKVGNGGQLKKSNSLEEISKTKLEDLTSEQSLNNSSSTSSSSAQVTFRRPNKQHTLDEDELFSERSRTSERRSWGTEDSQPYYCSDGPATVSADESGPSASGGRKRRNADEKRRMEEGIPALVVSTSSALEETEFHVVTKKKTRKKRRSSSGGRTGGHGGLFGEDSRRPTGSQYGQSYQNRGDAGGHYQRKSFNPGNGNGFPPHDRMVEREGGGVMLYHQYRHHHRPRSPEHLRRKSTSSMPPSDKSDSSDLDSVHSLPVSSTTPKLTLDQTSTSSGSTPQASYADITRMASSNVSSSSSTQGSCNMNAGKWPAVTTNKNQAPSTSTSTSTTITTTTTTVSTFSSTSATATSTSNASSTTSVPSLTAPLVPNNPQFITGPRLNIGVPPVSGSKATVSSASSTNTTSISSNSSALPSASVPTSSCTGEASTAAGAASLPSESRTKKDAMTSTTLDNKLVPSEEHNQSSKLQGTEAQATASNVIMDQYYPSLEESLVSDKVDRKPGRCSNSSVHSNASAKAPIEETPSNNVVSLNVTGNPENCGNKGSSGDVRLKQQPIEVSVDATVIVPRSNLCTAVELVPSEVPVASATATVMNRSKEVMSRSKSGGGRKLCAAGSNVVATSSVRPPVIILGEQEQEATFRENVGTVSELTFGFEVNEQLLLSDGDEHSFSASTELPSVVEETNAITNPGTGSVTSDETAPVVPTITSSASEDFSARYREPVTEQSESHDTIVAYVGNAWDAVVKEMNAPVQAGGKVQYYSGQ